MAENVQQEKLEKFTNLTGTDQNRARFYLESSGWNLQVALGSFYDNDNDDDDLYETAPTELPPPPVASSQSKGTSANPPAPSSRFATLANYQDQQNSSSDDEGQAFYAGGSEHSGQQVLGPKKKSDPKKIVEHLFKSAREHGAEDVEKVEQKPPGGNKNAFKGSGYRLGDTDDAPVDIVHGEPLTGEPRQVDMVLKLWKNGFSVDDGPLRDFKDPVNKEFLDSVSRGEVPRELIRNAKGGEVNLNMEDHREEEYVKPKVMTKAFSGAGHMLGSPAPSLSHSTPSAAAGSASGQAGDNSAAPSIPLNTSQPVTNLQIRLADGSRMVAKFNHTHRVQDVRQYIISARPQYATANFVLMTTFPNKELTNETQSLKDGQLLNAVIVQRMK